MYSRFECCSSLRGPSLPDMAQELLQKPFTKSQVALPYYRAQEWCHLLNPTRGFRDPKQAKRPKRPQTDEFRRPPPRLFVDQRRTLPSGSQ